ncbi:MAG: T9SS type A sorting domain-containing protein, partial [Bacteroidota bacterium]
GIIFIKANTIATNTVCGSAIKITANGGSTASCGNDGAGGGGAAGSIVLQVNNYSSNAACPLSINANGGNGGNVSDGAEHGGGGGGGQGTIVFSTVQPTVNISASTTNGVGGQNNASGASYAGNGGGTNNSGILSMGGPLPIELLNFNGEAEFSKVKLSWSTATEINNDYYVIERSADAISFTPLTKVKAIGNTRNTSNYGAYDNDPLKGINYYRLKQMDTDGNYNYTHAITVTFQNEFTLTVFPNPAGFGESVYLFLDKPANAPIEISVYDITGRQIFTKTTAAEKDNAMKICDQDMSKGIYMIRIVSGNTVITKKLIVD